MTRASRPWARRRVAGLVVATLCLLLLPPAAAASATSTVRAAASAARAAAPASAQGTGRPVVLVGAPGLRWADVNERDTPHLWRLAGSAALASTSVRTTVSWTCPTAGWLTVSAGQRASGVLSTDPQGAGAPLCPPPPQPRATSGGGAVVDQYAELRRRNADGHYAAQVGLVGDTVERAGRCVTAVGPGAALAGADARGRVTSYLPQDAPLTTTALTRCPLTVVDAGTVSEPDLAGTGGGVGSRAAQARAIDRRVGDVLAAAPAGATVLVVGVGDSSRDPQLSVAMARGPAPGGDTYGIDWLQTRSTRRTALVQLTDVAPTLLALLGLDEPSAAVGSTITLGDRRPATAAAVDELVDTGTKADVSRRYTAQFFVLLVVSQLLLYGAAAVALRREGGRSDARRTRTLQALRRAALVFAAVPVSTYLVNLFPWWRSGVPLLSLTAALLVCLVAVTAVAQLGPWRHRLLGPFGAVAAITGLVMLVDVVSGSTLQMSSLMGYSALVAGRFYGFGNPAFSVFATAMLLAATALADWLLVAGRRRTAVAAVAAVGVVAVVADGWPRFGSDFGGVIALVPGFAVLALLVAGARISWLRVVLIGLAAVATISLVAYLDWRHPPAERSHLGRFVQQVLDGDAGTVVQRKLAANLDAFRNWLLALLVPIGFAFVVMVLMRPGASGAAALARAYDRSPTLRLGVIALIVALGVAFAVNDSGIAIPAIALFLAIPLVLAAGVRALELDESDATRSAPARRPAR